MKYFTHSEHKANKKKHYNMRDSPLIQSIIIVAMQSSRRNSFSIIYEENHETRPNIGLVIG